MDVDWSGYGAQAVTFDCNIKMTRGAPVLRWAPQRIREDKALVEYLVWSNPSNLLYVSPELGANAEVAAAALASPFYAEKDPERPSCCVLSCFSDSVCENKEIVLAALARSGYELEFAGEALRADPYVVAWAGAPVGAAPSRGLSKTFMRLLKYGVSVEHVDFNFRALSEDKDFCATRCGDSNLSNVLQAWHQLPTQQKQGQSAFIKQILHARCPLCLRVAPPVRDVLWPTREEWERIHAFCVRLQKDGKEYF